MTYPYRVVLSEEQRAELRGLVGSGVAPARRLSRARFLRRADPAEGGTDAAIAGALAVNSRTVLRVRRGLAPRDCRRGAGGAGDRAGQLPAVGRGRPLEPAPARRRAWMRGTSSYETRAPSAQQHAVTPQLSAVVARPDGGLGLCPADGRHARGLSAAFRSDASGGVRRRNQPPGACAVAGQPARHDPESVRGGVAHLFIMTGPLRGWRSGSVSEQRTRRDFAACLKTLAADARSPAAQKPALVLDQRDTPSPVSLSAAFPPAEAKQVADTLEIHHAPTRGGSLNRAELALCVLPRPCWRQRRPDRAATEGEVAAWVRRRNDHTRRIDWPFTTTDARVKLRRLYPAFESWHTTRVMTRPARC